MKKEKMITRTMITTHVDVILYDVNDKTTFDMPHNIVGKVSVDDALEILHDTFDTDTLKVVMISKMEYIEKLYGMPESLFMEHATELPPRKVNETQEDV